MNIFNVIIDSLYEESNDMLCEGMLTSPVVAYLCSEDINKFEFVKYDETSEINEGFISNYKENLSNKEIRKLYRNSDKEVKAEKKALAKGKISPITNTDYKLSTEQKRFLKMLKRKYGNSLISEINAYRREILAPYQVIKKNLEGSKSLHSKDVMNMSKEEYLRAKKSAERKINDLGQDKYKKAIKTYGKLSDREKDIDNMNLTVAKGDISKPALTRAFKRYNLFSNRFDDLDFKKYESKMNNLSKFLDDLESGLKNKTNKENAAELTKLFDEVKKQKAAIIASSKTEKQKVSKEVKNTLDKLKDTQSLVQSIEIKIKNSDTINKEDKDYILNGFDGELTQNGVKLTSTSFADEYEMYLMREKIRNDIKNNISNKYTSEYNNQLNNLKDFIKNKKTDTIRRMANTSTIFTDREKQIYQLKSGAPKDSDKLEDYNLKIKEEDFFDSKYFVKSDEIKEAERNLDKIIKKFERSLASRLSDGDYGLLKKYRLINNLLVVKKTNAKT